VKSILNNSTGVSATPLLTALITTAIVIAGLYYGREVLIPFALALLLSFLLAPPVAWLERRKLRRAPSVVVVLLLAFSALTSLLWLGGTQLADIVSMLPSYKQNIDRKIEAMRNPAGSALAKAADSISTLSTELAKPETANKPPEAGPLTKPRRKGPAPAGKDATPVAVEVVQPQRGVVESIGWVSTSLLQWLELGAGVLIFTLFMLIHRNDLRNRLFRLFGQGHLNVMTTALDDAAQRVSKYLLTQSLVNGTFGLTFGLGLYWIGVPNAPFWGVLGAVLRFIPYVGSLTAGLCPLILALAVFEGWTKPVLTLGLFATIELFISSAVEPWLYGAHTGLSSLAILVSAAFWTLLWGPIGLVLSTPLTVCLLVMGRYVPALSSLSVLLGDQPVLPPEACYYQRLLAGDEDEALEVATNYLKDHTLLELYDLVLIPALSLAEEDRHDDNLNEERAEFIYQSTKSLVEELESHVNVKHSPRTAITSSAALSIFCVAARDKADELVGFMLRHILNESGFTVEVIPAGQMEEILSSTNVRPISLVFVSALPPLALSHARSTCRRVRRSLAESRIIVGMWHASEEKLQQKERWNQGVCDSVISSLSEAQTQIANFLETEESSEPLTTIAGE
jgi:predicted PurR-regulated permease PerM